TVLTTPIRTAALGAIMARLHKKGLLSLMVTMIAKTIATSPDLHLQDWDQLLDPISMTGRHHLSTSVTRITKGCMGVFFPKPIHLRLSSANRLMTVSDS